MLQYILLAVVLWLSITLFRLLINIPGSKSPLFTVLLGGTANFFIKPTLPLSEGSGSSTYLQVWGGPFLITTLPKKALHRLKNWKLNYMYIYIRKKL